MIWWGASRIAATLQPSAACSRWAAWELVTRLGVKGAHNAIEEVATLPEYPGDVRLLAGLLLELEKNNTNHAHAAVNYMVRDLLAAGQPVKD
jgi:hypothetical protein